jgi:hypothetical protein
MAKDVQQFFMCLYATYILRTGYQLIADLLIGLFVLLLFCFFSSLYILDINPLFVEQLVKIFSHSVGCLLILVTKFSEKF